MFLSTPYEERSPKDDVVQITWAKYLDLLLEGEVGLDSYEVTDGPSTYSRGGRPGGRTSPVPLREDWSNSPALRRATYTRLLLERIRVLRLHRRVGEAEVRAMSEVQLRNLLAQANVILEKRLLDEQEQWADDQWQKAVEGLRLSRDKLERVQAAAKRRKALAAAGGTKAVREDLERQRHYAQLRRRQRAAKKKT